jgi:hypothetical protein
VARERSRSRSKSRSSPGSALGEALAVRGRRPALDLLGHLLDDTASSPRTLMPIGVRTPVVCMSMRFLIGINIA